MYIKLKAMFGFSPLFCKRALEYDITLLRLHITINFVHNFSIPLTTLPPSPLDVLRTSYLVKGHFRSIPPTLLSALTNNRVLRTSAVEA